MSLFWHGNILFSPGVNIYVHVVQRILGPCYSYCNIPTLSMNSKYIEQSKSVSIKVLRGLFPEIKSTDELIAHLTSVEMVDLSSQQLTTVDGLDMLSELKSVQLQNNMINDFP